MIRFTVPIKPSRISASKPLSENSLVSSAPRIFAERFASINAMVATIIYRIQSIIIVIKVAMIRILLSGRVLS